jgi:hypothetical protein
MLTRAEGTYRLYRLFGGHRSTFYPSINEFCTHTEVPPPRQHLVETDATKVLLLQEKYLPTAIFPLGCSFHGIEGIIDEYHVAVVSPQGWQPPKVHSEFLCGVRHCLSATVIRQRNIVLRVKDM